MFEKLFQLKQNKTTVPKEILAGITTFMTMAYILAANPEILGSTGMDKGALFTATAVSSIVATLIMALVANLPFALAPGMGLNAFFAYTVVLGMGYSWQTALTAIFIEGIIFILLTAFNIRELIVNSIPLPLKHAISVGIGFFIALMGFINSGLIVADENTLVRMGNMSDVSIWITLSGLLVIAVLLILRLQGAILIGILAGTIIGIPLHVTAIPSEGIISLPPSIEPIFFKLNFRELIKPDILIVLFTFLFVDMFDTVGTLVGVSSKADMLDKDGNIPRVKHALFADAIGTTIGALLGTSTVTTYVESSAGVSVGGRTGLTAFVVAVCFALVLFFSPLFLMVPQSATASALIIIGLFMITPITKVELENYLDSIPVFLTIIMMPLAFSISEGISFGVISYVLLRIFTGRFSQVPVILYILAALFILRYFF
ncbi:MAG: NCS2 family permease [Bacteroidales bacterium]|nr:NCS2 family permease [Bacteroidales bacterium]